MDVSHLLQVWEATAAQTPVRRPLTWLSLVTGRDRNELGLLTIGERDRLLLQLRSRLFGSRVEAVNPCSRCGVQSELAFSVTDLAMELEVPKSVVVQVSGKTLRLKPLTGSDLETAAQSRHLREILFRQCLVDPLDVDLTDDLLAASARALGEADPQACIELSLSCPACEVVTLRRFDPWSFLWDEIGLWAYRTLRQVHVLASAYGWTEGEILSLSPQRRDTYLRMIAG